MYIENLYRFTIRSRIYRGYENGLICHRPCLDDNKKSDSDTYWKYHFLCYDVPNKDIGKQIYPNPSVITRPSR